MPRVLLVEDDPIISKSLKMSLSYKGYDVTVGETRAQATHALAQGAFDLLILDVNLPDGTGFDICESVRKSDHRTPIIMLTARVDEESAVKGMRTGADDYVRKPFGVQELVARMDRLLERKAPGLSLLMFGSLKMDPNKRKVWSDESEIHLGKREFDILQLLMKKNGDVVTRNDIMDALGEESEIYDRTIDSHLSHLRKKLRNAVGKTKAVEITAIYGVGYRLEEK